MKNKELADLIHNELTLMGVDLPYTVTINIIERVLDESNSGANVGYSEPASQGGAVAEDDREEIIEALLDCFQVACNTKQGYDHMFISTYENAQELLIRLGKIKQSECYRP